MKKHLKILYLIALVAFMVVSAQGVRAQVSGADKAKLDGFLSQIEKSRSEGNKRLEAEYMNKAADVYWDSRMFAEAADLFKKSLDLNNSLNNKNAVGQISVFLGMLYSDMGNYSQALTHYQKGLEINKSFGRKFNIAQSLVQVATAYRELGQPDMAIKNLHEAEAAAKELPRDLSQYKLLRSIYGELANSYQKQGNADKAFEYTGLYKTFNDLINKGQINEMQEDISNIDAQKRQTELLLNTTTDSLKRTQELTRQQQLELEVLSKQKQIDSLAKAAMEADSRELKIKNAAQRNYIILMFFVLAVIAAAAVVILREYREKKKAHAKLATQYVVLDEQKNKIETQATLIEKSYTELTKKNKQITDSIEYAKKIQEAILPSKVAIKQNMPDSFVLYRPKDIVSGDFYWFSRQNNYLFIAAVDCTGHSVPGAFMSMIGNTLLNEIVNEKKIHTPSEILQQLNSGVIQALKQDQTDDLEDDTQNDGMDLSMCRIDLANNELQFALANHSAYYISDGELNIIEGDIHSIGGMFSMRPNIEFTNHVIQCSSDVWVYMFSDGYQDQFGGENNKKFMETRMRQMIEANYKQDMQKQRDVYEAELLKWKGAQQQTDDILLIGFHNSF